MSGSIRKVLGPARKRVSDLLTKPIPTFNANDFSTFEEKLQQIDIVRIQLRHDLDKLTAAIEFLLSKDQQWLNLIPTLGAEAQKVEEAKYAEYLDSDTGHYAYIVRGQDRMAEIKSNLTELDLLAHKYELEQERELPRGPPLFPPPPALSARTDTSNLLKLPKLELPTFDGNPINWLPFWDIFQSAVHSHPQLSKVQKFTYLTSKLTHSAATAVAGLTVTEQNYDVAVRLLQDRFGKQDIIIGALFSQLRNMKVSTTSAKDLRTTYDFIEKYLRQLESLGEDIEQALLVDMLRGKLPSETLLDLQKVKRDTSPWTVSELRQALRQVIETHEEVQRITQNQVSYRNPKPPQSHSQGNSQKSMTTAPNSSTGAMSTNVQPTTDFTQPAGQASSGSQRAQSQRQPQGGKRGSGQPKKLPSCAFCTQSHYSANCTEYTTAASRKAALSKRRDVTICFRCLRTGHVASKCQLSVKCYYCKATNHHSAFCYKQFPNSGGTTSGNFTADTRSLNAVAPTTTQAAGSSTTATQRTAQAGTSGTNVSTTPVIIAPPNPPSLQTLCEFGNHSVRSSMLLTAITQLRNPTNSMINSPVQIFFDNGAQRTFITSDMATKLQLQPDHTEQLLIYSFGSTTPQSRSVQCVSFEVLLRDGTVINLEAVSLPHLANSQVRPPLSDEDSDFIKANYPTSYFADDVPFEALTFKPDVIVGSDYYWDFLLDTPKIQLPTGLFIIPSKVGLLLGGKHLLSANTTEKFGNFPLQVSFLMNQALTDINCYQSDTVPASDLDLLVPPNIEDFWSLESIGITDSPQVTDDEVAFSQFRDSIQFQNGRYLVKWPTKPELLHDLPDNRELALRRFQLLAQPFQQDPDLLAKYAQIIQDQCDMGIIELVPMDAHSDDHAYHYLPHHPVITPSKATTKVRIVYDGSARLKNCLSINDCLLRGPVILPDLCGLLLRFTLAPIGIVSDVEKAFLQVGLQPPDRDLTRFWWFRDPTNPSLQDNLQIYRFARVPFGIISSPFLLAATIQHHLEQIESPVAKTILASIYVDNVIAGAQSVSDAVQFYQEAKQLFASASMNLREWSSNSSAFMASIPSTDQVKNTIMKILGLLWDTNQDLFLFKGPTIGAETTPTKRFVLKIVASIFDPLGFVSPVTLLGKMFIQKLWRLSFGWDEPLAPDLLTQWLNLSAILQEISHVAVPRYLEFNPEVVSELHVFVDASSNAYSAVVYLRQAGRSKLLFAKTRLAPQKPTMTIPRLELLAVLIGCRLLVFLRDQLPISISGYFLWTDSECCLQWLISTRALSRFVKNRIAEIHSIQTKLGNLNFHYVSTNCNPADQATRGLTVPQLMASTTWWSGPHWLVQHSDMWPEHNLPPVTAHILDQVEEEFAKTERPIHSFHTTTVVTSLSSNFLGISLERFSSLTKLFRTTVFSLRFLKRIAVHRSFSNASLFFRDIQTSGPILLKELEAAKLYWHTHIQQTHYPDILNSLQMKAKSQPALVNQLGLYLDKYGVIRCQGRFQYASFPDSVKFPILLPKFSHFTKLVIWFYHQRNFHCGVQQTLASLRQMYWLPQGRMGVRKLLATCPTCKSIQGGPYSLPSMAPLPYDRLNQSRPFQFTGLDYLGPVWYKSHDEKFKCWICLFTCLLTRAVHLEFVADMSAKEFLNSLRRFFARRGVPKKVLSDNASQFQLTKDALSKAWQQMVTSDDVVSFCNSEGIQWSMTTPFAPWQGGIYERLVGITKNAMKKAVGRKLLTLNQLLTLLPEIEAILNSRPLTYIYADVNSPMVLRPIDFLLPKADVGTPPLDEDHNDPDYVPRLDPPTKLLKLWHSSQAELDKFWSFWQEEYLVSLRERTQTTMKHPRIQAPRAPKIGDVVLIFQENLPRGAWKLGRISQLITSKDGYIRSAEVTLPSKNSIARPINHLYPLEAANQWDFNAVTSNSVLHSSFSTRSTFSLSYVTICLVMLFNLLMSPLAGALHSNRTYYICASGRNGHAVSIPRTITCSLPHGAPLEQHLVDVWSQRQMPLKTPGYHCYLQTHTIVTHTSFVMGKGILYDSTSYAFVPPNTCWSTVHTKMWDHSPLHEISEGFWSTNHTLEVEYKWCCYDHEMAVSNFILEVGEIASINGHDIITDLQDLSSCSARSGHCQDPHYGTTVWNNTVFQYQCRYILHGHYWATLSSNSLVIEKLQAAFSFSGRDHPPESDCVPEHAFYTDQGAVFIDFTNSTPHIWYTLAQKAHLVTSSDVNHEDLSNYKRQYLFQKIQQIERRQFGLLWQQLCSIRQGQLNHIWQLLRLDPTLGIRALLGREDIHARWAGDALIFWECKNITPFQIFWSGHYNGSCYKYVPVKLSPAGPLWFIAPGSKDLVDSSPKEQCVHTTPNLFQTKDGWRSVHGPVHVSEIPIELAWKGLWRTFTFHAPSLFVNSLNHLPMVPDIHHQLLRLLVLETSMNKLINYTASMSLNPQVIHNTLTGVGDAIGHIVESNGKALGHIVTGIADGLGSLADSLLKGPLQLLLNILLICLVLLGLGFVGYKLLLWRCKKHAQHHKHARKNSPSPSFNIDNMQQDTPVILEIEPAPKIEGEAKSTEVSSYSLRYH